MKKLIFLSLIVVGYFASYAQESLVDEKDSLESKNLHKPKVNYSDSIKQRLCIDLDLLVGTFGQSLTGNSLSSFYPNTISSITQIDKPTFKSGSTLGFDLGFGYFLGRKRNWGFGLGINYLSQSGNISIGNYNVSYQAKDDSGYIYRQQINSNGAIIEKVKVTNLNIPIVAKYRRNLGSKLSVTADAGLVYNLSLVNNYTTNASFDYGAIYLKNNNGNYIYDASATPNVASLIITKAGYLSQHHGSSTGMVNYFQQEHSIDGKNVGLNVLATPSSGTVNYTQGKIGFILRPMMNYELTDNISLNGGLYFMFQPFTNAVSSDYKLADKVGGYNSVLNGVTSNTYTSFGVNLGVRYYFGKLQDRDKDTIPDKFDECPDIPGLRQYWGCPDFDKDGIPDKDDSCPRKFGLAKFGGCPDTDGDGIPDRRDSCPKVAGLIQFGGCPDTDGDGVPDRRDSCPTVKGPISNHGCPINVKKKDTSEEDVFNLVVKDKKKDTVTEKEPPVAKTETKKEKDAREKKEKVALAKKEKEEKAALAKQEKEAAAKQEKEDKELAKKLALEEKKLKKEQEIGQKEKDKKEKEQSKREAEIAKREAELAKREKELETKEQEVAEKEKQVVSKEKEVLNKEKEVAIKEKELINRIETELRDKQKFVNEIDETQKDLENTKKLNKKKRKGITKKEDIDKQNGEEEAYSEAGSAIHFELGKAVVKESAKPAIMAAVKQLKENKDAEMVIEGYTDTTGPITFNKLLSIRRAIVLKNYLISLGVDPKRIKTVGMGSKNPAADNSTKAGRMKNRRAEMKIKK